MNKEAKSAFAGLGYLPAAPSRFRWQSHARRWRADLDELQIVAAAWRQPPSCRAALYRLAHGSTIGRTAIDEIGQKTTQNDIFSTRYTVPELAIVECKPAHFRALAEHSAETMKCNAQAATHSFLFG